eukprot:TRINITY_DN1917_c0_g1_i2.p1 TRINITY_DN1917_c0_g1~~TRINITY_DN1917_c0_g1_i2.p1  ORF type:complete len:165 (+),score=24.14 TRINITY_DN1917_c0_g1_i2:43-537(+)
MRPQVPKPSSEGAADQRRFKYRALRSSEDMGQEGDTEFSLSLVADGSVDYKGKVASRRTTGGWKASPLIFVTEICERMATLGLQRNLVTYFVNQMHLTNSKAANMVSNFVGTNYFTPFIGGFMADSFMGRFWAITSFASVQAVVNMKSLPDYILNDKIECAFPF